MIATDQVTECPHVEFKLRRQFEGLGVFGECLVVELEVFLTNQVERVRVNLHTFRIPLKFQTLYKVHADFQRAGLRVLVKPLIVANGWSFFKEA